MEKEGERTMGVKSRAPYKTDRDNDDGSHGIL